MAQPQFDENGMLVGIVEGEASPAAAPAVAAPEAAPEMEPAAEAAPEDAPEAAPEEDDGRGLGFYAGEAAKAVVGGIRDGAVEAVDTMAWAGDSVANALTGGHRLIKTQGDDGWEWLTADEAYARDDIDSRVLDAAFGKYELDDIVPEVAPNETIVGGIGRGATQFLTGYGFVGKATSALRASTKGGQVALATGRGMLTDFMTFDAHEDRFSDFLRDNFGLTDPITEFLQADEDDSILEGKLKNTLEGAGLGIATDALLGIIKGFKRAKKVQLSDGSEAAARVMNDTIADMADDGQLSLFDEMSDPNLRSDTVDLKVVDKREGAAKPKPAAEAKPDAPAEGAASVTLHNNGGFKAGREVDGEALTQYLEYDEGLRKGGSIPDPDRLPSKAIFNMDKLMGDADIKDFVNAAAEQVQDRLIPKDTTFAEMQRAGAKELAEMVNGDPFHVDRALAELAGTSERAVAVIQASKALMTSLAGEAYRLSDEIASGTATDATRNQLVRVNARLAELAGNLKASTKTAAQVTVSGRIEQTHWLTGEALKEADIMAQVQKNVGDREATDKLAELILLNRNANGGTRGLVTISEGSKGGFKAFMEFYINSILSGPKTHVINVLSNGANMALLPAEKMIGGALARDRSMVLEGFRQYQGMRVALADSVKMMKLAFKQGRNLLDPEAALLEANGVDYRAIRSDSKNALVRNTINAVGEVVRFPSRMLITSDEFFKQMNYRSSVYAELMGTAAEHVDAGRLNRADVAQWVADRLDASITKSGTARSEHHIDYAREATYTQDLRKGSMSKWVQDGTNKYPALKLILPFVRTPTNILKAGVQRTPVLRRLSKTLMADIASGDPRRMAIANGKLVTGSTLWATAAAYAASGNLTGTGPANPAEKARLMETGWRPYSFKVGDKYISYQRMDPFAMFFGIAADIAAMSGEVGDNTNEEIATAAVIALVNNIGSKTYLSGIIDAVDAIGQPERYLHSTAQRYASAMVPMSAAMREMRRMGDPAMREVRTILDSIRDTIPGQSANLPPRRSWITGKTIHYPVGWGADMVSPVGDAFASMNPITQGKDLNDKVLDELASLKNAFSAPTRKQDGTELTSEQYARFNELHGTLKIRGMTLYERLGSTIDSDRYQSFSKMADDPATDPRVKVLSSIISSYREAAKAQLYKEYPELMASYRKRQADLAANARGNNNPAPVSYEDLIQAGQ